MAKRGAQPGNTNATKNRPWRDAINSALKKREQSRVDGKLALDALAEKLLEKCDEGDLAALRELGDRIEGKAAQTIEGEIKGNIIVTLSKEDAEIL